MYTDCNTLSLHEALPICEGYQAGFRMELGSDASAFTLQGDLFETDSEIFADNGENGHNILARWIRQLGGESSLQLQAYYDDFEREFPLVRDALETFDVQGQYSGSAGRHRFVVGGGDRKSTRLNSSH